METIYAGVICNSDSEYGCLLSGERPEASRPLCWVGFEEILEYEIPKLANDKIRQLQEKLKKMNLKGFSYDFYEDDETKFGDTLAKKHESFIKKISNELIHPKIK